MKHSKYTYYQFILALLLSICLMAGCVAPAPSAGSSSAAPEQTTAAQNTPAPTRSPEEEKAAQADAQESFDALTDKLFKEEAADSLITLHYTLANPADYGITDYDKTLGSVSLEKSAQVISDAKSLNTQLQQIDSRLLRRDQLLTYTILSSYINTLLSSDGLALYDQPLSSSLGIQAQLPILLSEYVFYSRQDIEDYLSLLSSMDTYYDTIITFENQQADAGLGLCDTVLDRIIESCNAYLIDADHCFLSETFTQRLEAVEGLSDKEKADYTARNKAAINEHFVPAYENLMKGLEDLKGRGVNDKGLSYYPDGKKYYQYLVNLNTGTSYTDVPSLKKAIIAQMVDDLSAVDELLQENPDIHSSLDSFSFALTEPNAILEDLRSQSATDFPPIKDYSCTIKSVPKALESVLSPAFYLTVPIDRPQDNSIYINNGSTSKNQSLYTTMAHEGYPGHMYQTLYFNQNNTCNLRKLLSFTSYSEGWATYVEYKAYGLNNGLPDDLSQLLQHNAAFTLALYAMMDINIHYDGWNMEQVEKYLNLYFDISDPTVISTIYYDIVENPSNYLTYYTGYLEILKMENEAQKTLGSKFSQLEFNRFLLDIGPAPFSVIRPYFSQWMIGVGTGK